MTTPRHDPAAGETLCDTCRKWPASHLAHHKDNGDTWQVCGACRAQAIRYQAPIIHHPLIAQTEAS